ncbi:MAG TPA: hypothetical protein VFC39_03280 [Acidobacteriaceae bacterium]|nr:hypothetical protein [Acidobacteriaceae bacterium]
MVVRVEKVVGGYAILLPPEVGKEWSLHDGSVVEVHRVGSVAETARYTSVEEAMEIYRSTLPQYDAVYRELAKGPEGVGPHDPLPYDPRKL